MVERNGNGDKSLENWIWDAACSIRGAQEAAKYKDFILPLIFTKRLCDVFDDELNRIAEKVGSRAKAFKLVAMDHNLVRFYLPLQPQNPDDPVWSLIRKLSDKIGEKLTDYLREIAKAIRKTTFLMRELSALPQYEDLRQIARAGGSTKAALTCGFLKSYPIPLPKNKQDQIVIAQVFSSLNIKISSYQSKILLLQDLFRTLLHQLMTAQIRVDDLNLSALNLEQQGGDE